MLLGGPEFLGVGFFVLPHSPSPVCPTAPPFVPFQVVLCALYHPTLCPTPLSYPSVPHSCPITSRYALRGSFCAPFPLRIIFLGGGRGCSVYPITAPHPTWGMLLQAPPPVLKARPFP